MFILDNRW